MASPSSTSMGRWPDLLFVNGKQWTAGAPGPSHAFYRNNHDGDFHQRHRGQRLRRARRLRTRGDGRRLRQRRPRRRVRDDNRRRPAVAQRGRRPVRGRDARAGIRNTDVRRQRRLARLRPRRAPRSVHRELRAVVARGRNEVRCTQDGERGYCGPDAYKPVAPKLYHNLGGGRFEDVTARAGLDDPSRQGDGRRCARLQRGRLAGPVRRQRPRARKAVSQ